jgi:hypothetical protein
MSNYNVRGPHSNVTDQTPRVNENGKRSIRNLATAIPGGINARIVHPRGPTVVPRIGARLPVQKYSSQIHQQTNNTSSTLLFASARRNDKEGPPVPGTLLFAKGTSTRLSKVRTLCEMNKDQSLRCGNYHMLVGTSAEDDSNSAEDDSNTFFFYGILRGEVGKMSGRERLYNCDVRGRTMIGNIFGSVKRGDRVGLGIVMVKDSALGNETSTRMLLPFVNGELVPAFHDVCEDEGAKFNGLHPCISLGVVSNNTSETPSRAHIRQAVWDSNRYTTLRQIETLMV